MNINHLKRQLENAKRIATPKSIILWGQEDLLGNAVVALLTARSDWNLIRVQDEADIEALALKVEQFKPELMLVNRNDITRNFPPLLRLVQSCPTLKILTINPENNLVEIYDKHMLQLKNISDLLAILDEPAQPIQKGGDANQQMGLDQAINSPVTQAGKLENKRSKNDNP